VEPANVWISVDDPIVKDIAERAVLTQIEVADVTKDLNLRSAGKQHVKGWIGHRS